MTISHKCIDKFIVIEDKHLNHSRMQKSEEDFKQCIL